MKKKGLHSLAELVDMSGFPKLCGLKAAVKLISNLGLLNLTNFSLESVLTDVK